MKEKYKEVGGVIFQNVVGKKKIWIKLKYGYMIETISYLTKLISSKEEVGKGGEEINSGLPKQSEGGLLIIYGDTVVGEGCIYK